MFYPLYAIRYTLYEVLYAVRYSRYEFYPLYAIRYTLYEVLYAVRYSRYEVRKFTYEIINFFCKTKPNSEKSS
jgi:hypothetical protein